MIRDHNFFIIPSEFPFSVSSSSALKEELPYFILDPLSSMSVFETIFS